MSNLARWAVLNWMRFDPERPAAMELSGSPRDCMSWKVGPDVPASANPAKAASSVWCAVGTFREREKAEAAFDDPGAYLPDSSGALEHWRALLSPFAHRGECNHLSASCGLLFDIHPDPGGPLVVMTTAGFELRAKSDFQRLKDFRRRVEAMRSVIEASEGNLAHQVFAPLAPGDDGVTMSLWRDDGSMFAFAYKPGAHRVELDRQNSHRTVDRSSFTRFRVVRSHGLWKGKDPCEGA